ncbi:MAG TPA: hypothetical protein VD905_02860 [Flavobacteriales bacterium]|nr:hypothetical protein [Flavobacteriales bacterium]
MPTPKPKKIRDLSASVPFFAVKKASDLISGLLALRTTFGPGPEQQKLDLLKQFPKTELKTKKDILTYHEHLLFMLAYPDSTAVQKAVTSELKRLGKLFKDMEAKDPAGFYDVYHATGIAYSSVSWMPSVDISAWMVDRFAKESIEPRFDDDFYGNLAEALPMVVKPSQADSLLDNDFEAETWMDSVAGKYKVDHLRWINEQFLALNTTEPLRDKLFDEIGVDCDLKIDSFEASRTGNVLPCRNMHYQTGPLLKGVNIKDQLAKPFLSFEKLKGRELASAIQSGRDSLCARSRETDTVTYADTVYRVELEHGIDIYLYEMRPNRKMPIENYLGYVGYKNGVPMAYGGSWIFLDRMEIGLNIFDSFRGGESALAFVSLLRAYQRLFNSKRILVPPYQFGENNPEGLKSGAFWFYYRLGFRPADAKLKALADKEAEKIAKKKNYRTSIDVLKKFTVVPVELILDDAYAKVDLRKLSAVAGKQNSSVITTPELKRMLGLTNLSGLEKASVDAVAPLVCIVPGIADWSPVEKETLAEILKKKYTDELNFTVEMGKHRKLIESWEKILS